MEIPDGTNVITKGQFSGKNMYRVFIPKSVEKIENSAFKNCENLKEVVFEEGSRLKIIGGDAFRDCKCLAEMTFPEGLEKINSFAFYETGL